MFVAGFSGGGGLGALDRSDVGGCHLDHRGAGEEAMSVGEESVGESRDGGRPSTGFVGAQREGCHLLRGLPPAGEELLLLRRGGKELGFGRAGAERQDPHSGGSCL